MFAVLFLNDNNQNSKTMPKKKIYPKIIDESLAAKCRLLIKTDDKKAISNQTGFSVAYIEMVIAGKRFNKEIIKSLSNRVTKIINSLEK